MSQKLCLFGIFFNIIKKEQFFSYCQKAHKFKLNNKKKVIKLWKNQKKNFKEEKAELIANKKIF